MTNRLFHGYCNNTGNADSKIKGFVITTVRYVTDYNGGRILEEVKTLQEFFNQDGNGKSLPFYHVTAILNDEMESQTRLFDDDCLDSVIYAVEKISGHRVIET